MGGRGAVSSSGRGIGSASSFLDEKHMSMVFMNGTRAEFSQVTGEEWQEITSRKPDYVSNSGSQYWYTEDSVYRMSDHWGDYVASCDWRWKGFGNADASTFKDTYGNSPKLGRASWKDFKPKESAAIYDYSKSAFDQYITSKNVTMSQIAQGQITYKGKKYKARFDRQLNCWTFERGRNA